MTGWRYVVGWKPELVFGVENTSIQWEYILPAMSMFSYNENNNMKYTDALGRKTWDSVSAGRYKGDWSLNGNLDYNHFKILLNAVSGYVYNDDYVNSDGNSVTQSTPGAKHIGVHRFYVNHASVQKSFSICVWRFNDLSGTTTYGNNESGRNEMVTLLGCVCSSFSLDYSGTSQSSVSVKMSGVYAKPKIKTGNEFVTMTVEQLMKNADANHVSAGEEHLPISTVEWGCVQIPEGTPIANTEKVNVSVNSSVNLTPTCGDRFDSGYSEGKTTITGSTTVYSRDPTQWIMRFYSGGFANTPATALNDGLPLSKNLKPIPQMAIASRDANKINRATVRLDNVAVNSINNSLSVGAEIVDSPSYNAQEFELEIRTETIVTSLI